MIRLRHCYCPKCGKENFDAGRFGTSLQCNCGAWIPPTTLHSQGKAVGSALISQPFNNSKYFGGGLQPQHSILITRALRAAAEYHKRITRACHINPKKFQEMVPTHTEDY